MFIFLTIFIIFTILIGVANIIESDGARMGIAMMFGIILFTSGLFLVSEILKMNDKNKEYQVILLKNNLADITTNGSIILK